MAFCICRLLKVSIHCFRSNVEERIPILSSFQTLDFFSRNLIQHIFRFYFGRNSSLPATVFSVRMTCTFATLRITPLSLFDSESSTHSSSKRKHLRPTTIDNQNRAYSNSQKNKPSLLLNICSPVNAWARYLEFNLICQSYSHNFLKYNVGSTYAAILSFLFAIQTSFPSLCFRSI